MSSKQNDSLEKIVDSIEEKLSRLEDERAEIRQKIELKQAQIRELNKAIEIMDDFENKLGEG